MIYVSVISALLAVASAECPNACSSHGKCTAYDMCLCYRNWMSNDCSERVCQFGLAHVDTPKGDLDASSGELDGPNTPVAIHSEVYPFGTTEQFPEMKNSAGAALTETAHYYMECSNKGICDRSAGVCECFPGYEGSACQRASCPSSGGATCSGHGTCETIKQIAKRDSENIYELWDEKATMGCVCDAGYYGPDCSMRRCKYGADPLYFDDNANIRYSTWNVIFGAEYDASPPTLSGTFSIVFYDHFGEDWETDPIAADADCEAIIAALEGLDNDVIPKDSVRCQLYEDPNWDLPEFFSAAGAPFLNKMSPLVKFALSFPENPGYLKEIQINKHLDGTRPTLNTNEDDSTLQIFVYPDGFTGEDFDVVPDECENVIVTFGAFAAGRHALEFFTHNTNVDASVQEPLLKRCLGQTDNDPAVASDVYQWDFGTPINPHLVKFIPRDAQSVKLCPKGAATCTDSAPQGFYAPVIFTTDTFHAYIHLRSDMTGTGNKYRVFTTTGYLNMVSLGADVISRQVADTDSWSMQLSNVVYTTTVVSNPTYVNAVSALLLGTAGTPYPPAWTGNVDCETYTNRVNRDDCLQKGDHVMFFSAMKDIDSDKTNPRFHNMYTVQKIFTDTTSGDASAYQNKIVLNTHTNFYAIKPDSTIAANEGVHVRAYKFYPPAKPVRYVDECSGRGLCNTADGICECFSGYTYDDCSIQNSAAK